jgi:phosphate-selective porin OprO/OprP
MKKIVLIVFALIFGLSMNAQDKKENVKFKPTIKFNGRVQYDFEFIKPTWDNITDAEQDAANFNGNEFRRAYLSAKGKIGKKLGYKVEFEFAGSKIGYRDVYISYDAGKAGKFAVGSMAEATGLNMTTSSKYITFMERSMLTSFQDFRWGAGFHYANYKIADDFTLQMSLTNNNGKHDEGFKDEYLEDGMNFVARATYAVINNKENNSLVHLGVNYDSRQGKTTKLRLENHMGHKYKLGFDADKRSDLGFEVATNFGSLSIQGEYKMNSNDVDKDVYGQDNYKVNTYYAFVSYFLTGEHRPYKHGTFGRVKPKHDVDNGGFGALELAARYSAVDNSDKYKDYASAGSDIERDIYKTSNLTFGLNWYLNSHARVMYNAVLTDFSGDNGEKQLAHMLRFAVDF